MKSKFKIKGQLRLYTQWPLIMGILLAGMNIWVYMIDKKAGALMAIVVGAYIFITGMLYIYSRSVILSDLVEFAAQYGVAQNRLLEEIAAPYAILMDDGKIIWMNEQFYQIIGETQKRDTYLSKYMPELNRSIFPKNENGKVTMEVEFRERDYHVELSNLPVAGLKDSEQVLPIEEDKGYFITVYLQDVTELNRYVKENEEQRLVAGLVYIDNYEEVMDSVEEVRQSLLVALIDRKINQYIGSIEGIAKKLEKDKYFVVIKKKYFKTMKENKFSLLEDVKSVNIGNEMPATLSIGLGLSSETYAQSYNYARVAIDLALARGGDQVVVKDAEGISYYGGKREQSSKNTRVKARVKAEALREFILGKDRILIMGHKLTDADAFGAAVGIYRIAEAMKKEAHIVINEITTSVRPLYEFFMGNENYPQDLFVKSEQAMQLVNDDTMVVVVDTNKPELTECEMLLKKAKMIVVLDHHRQGSDAIDNAILSYIEPYASSTCEMVAEVLQYIVDDIKLPSAEANCMYSGIMIDTNNFTNRTGVRTFEAAAYLRRCGADITYIRKLFRDDKASYQVRAEIIAKAEVYRNEYAIAVCENEEIESPTIIGAQAANELLNIENIKASFVLTVYHGRIYISARSIDEVNVQLIMEHLGGGGHINTAGAQFAHTNLVEATAALKDTLDDMIREGDI